VFWRIPLQGRPESASGFVLDLPRTGTKVGPETKKRSRRHFRWPYIVQESNLVVWLYVFSIGEVAGDAVGERNFVKQYVSLCC
jgi:hypothetical protein